MLALTVPCTGKGVFTTLTGMLAVVAAAIGLTRGLAPTVSAPIRTATVARTMSPNEIERAFLNEYMLSPPDKFLRRQKLGIDGGVIRKEVGTGSTARPLSRG